MKNACMGSCATWWEFAGNGGKWREMAGNGGNLREMAGSVGGMSYMSASSLGGTLDMTWEVSTKCKKIFWTTKVWSNKFA